MENNMFIELCKTNFSYLTEEFGFSIGYAGEDGIRTRVIYEKPGLSVEVAGHITEPSSLPVSVYLAAEEKRLMDRLLKKSRIYALDDVLIYRKCNVQVYEYLDYTNINTFYKRLPEDKLKYYEDKYSSDEEIRLIIDRYSVLLKDFGSDILRGDFSVLQEVRRLWKKYDKQYGR
jgi:hypothetical protein